MSAWRREALRAVPALRDTVACSDSPMALWIELLLAFERAFQAADAPQMDRILRYAAWCSSDAAGRLPSDASTAVVCAFYEHLAAKREYWPCFRRWFEPAQFTALLPVFAYHLQPA